MVRCWCLSRTRSTGAPRCLCWTPWTSPAGRWPSWTSRRRCRRAGGPPGCLVKHSQRRHRPLASAILISPRLAMREDRRVTEQDVITALTAEADQVDAWVAGLDAAGWARPTPALGWTIAHQIAHLSFIFRLAGP